MSDSPKDSQEYRDYEKGLADHDALVDTVYNAAIENVYDEGCCSFGRAAQAFIRDIRFCGREWLMEQVEWRVKKLGY